MRHMLHASGPMLKSRTCHVRLLAGPRSEPAEPVAILVPVPRIYTRTGDDGTTGLLYGGRISKADPATEAYGTVDEAVAAIGLARSLAEDAALKEEILG